MIFTSFLRWWPFWEILLSFTYNKVVFLENLMPTLNNLNKEIKNKASMLKVDGILLFLFFYQSCI